MNKKPETKDEIKNENTQIPDVSNTCITNVEPVSTSSNTQDPALHVEFRKN